MRDKYYSSVRKIMSFVSALLTSCVLLCAFSVTAYAELDADVVLDDCEALAWHGGAKRDNKEYIEGDASVSWTVSPGGSFVVQRTWSNPVNGTGANRLEFDFYVSDAGMFYSITGDNAIEITSSGVCDVEETSWTLTSLDVEDGWNHVVLEIPENGGCDISKITFMRFYANGHNTVEKYTIGIDDIKLTYEEPSDEDVSNIPTDFVIGPEEPHTAVPETDVLTDEDNSEDEDVEKKQRNNVNPFGAILLCIAFILVMCLISVIIKKKNKTFIIVIACLFLLTSVLTVIAFVTPRDGDDQTNTTGETEDVEDNKYSGLLSFDQTGHPEVSAETVDVEALLTVDPEYDVKEDYKVRYSGIKTLEDYSEKPHVFMAETPVENGMSFQALTPESVKKMTIAEKECWLFVHFRKDDTNKFRLSLDDSLVEQYKGKTLRLNFAAYVNMETTFTVEYVDASGNSRTAVSENNNTRNAWTEFHVDLESPSFDGSKEGYDFFVTCTGPELIRIHAIYVTEGTDATEIARKGLIQTEYEQSFYVVAEANVLEYGALGDGYSNDTDAFIAAIEAVSKAGGGTVFVPAGYYCLTKTLTLPTNVALAGELEQGTANGTVLCIYGGKGNTDPAKSAIIMKHQSSVQNIAFWYPEQTFVNGTGIPYPPTITQDGSESVTVRNVTFVNAYFGLNYATLAGFSSNSLQYTRDIYGTCLHIGYENDPSFDIGKLENFNFSPKYWLESGLPGTPNKELLRTYMLRNSTGIILERIDWTYIADINIEGYNIGIHARKSSSGNSNGHMYNVNLKNCYYCFRGDDLSWMIASNCNFYAVGNEGATALYLASSCSGDMVLTNSKFESVGANAVVNYGDSKLVFNNCSLTSKTGTAFANVTEARYSLVNSTVAGGDARNYNIVIDDSVPSTNEVAEYGKTIVTKPASQDFIRLTDEPYNAKAGEDITETLQKALDDLKDTGGMVYLPAGTYYVSDHIDVWAGIELRGIAIWAQSFNTTRICTAFGHNDPDGEPLITLYDGSGLRGLSVVYHEQNTNDLQPYSFTIQGNGKNIYIVDVCLPTSWNAVDFATYRCDNHYIEYLWGSPLNMGIVVGSGSENGIIRDCHFTPNCFAVHTDDNWWTGPYLTIMSKGKPYVIGESKNQILYHNFTYGAYHGLSVLDGADNVYVLCHGVDAGNISAYFSGDCTATLVDTQLVNLDKTNGLLKDISPVYFNYVYTNEDFAGKIDFINLAGWGTCKNAFCLNGMGSVNVYGGKLESAGAPMCRLNAGSASFVGVINDSRTTDVVAGDDAINLNLSGNIFASGIRLDDTVTDGLLTGTDVK